MTLLPVFRLMVTNQTERVDNWSMSPDQRPGESADVRRLRDIAADEKEQYQGDSERPLAAFSAIMGTYAAAVTGIVVVLRRHRRLLPEHVGAADLALMTVATHKLSRLLAKDPVTSPLRAPFTRFAGSSGPGELREKVRGEGPRKAIGALVTCPFCLGVWVSTGFASALVLAPRATRLAASVLTAVAGADVLQLAYAWLEQKSSS